MPRPTPGAARRGNNVRGRVRDEDDRVAFEIEQIPGRARWDPLIAVEQEIAEDRAFSRPTLPSAGE